MASDVRLHAQLHHLKACTGFALLGRGVSTDIVNVALTVIDSWAQFSALHDSPLQANYLSSMCTQPQPVDEMSARMHAIHPSSMCLNQNFRDVESAEQAQKNEECTASMHASRSTGQPRKLIFLNDLLPETIRSHDAGPETHFEPPHGDSVQGPIEHATSLRRETLSQLNALTIAHDELRGTLRSLETRLTARTTAAANEQITNSISAALVNFVPIVSNALQPVMDEIGARGQDNCAELHRLSRRLDELQTPVDSLRAQPLAPAVAVIAGPHCSDDGDGLDSRCPCEADGLPLPSHEPFADCKQLEVSPRSASRGAELLDPGAAPAPLASEHVPPAALPADSRSVAVVDAASGHAHAERQPHASRQVTLIRAHQKQLAYADGQIALIRAYLARSGSAVNEPRAFCKPSQILTSERTSASSCVGGFDTKRNFRDLSDFGVDRMNPSHDFEDAGVHPRYDAQDFDDVQDSLFLEFAEALDVCPDDFLHEFSDYSLHGSEFVDDLHGPLSTPPDAKSLPHVDLSRKLHGLNKHTKANPNHQTFSAPSSAVVAARHHASPA